MKANLLILAALGLLALTARRERIQFVYQGSPANYQLYIFGGQSLRCRGELTQISTW